MRPWVHVCLTVTAFVMAFAAHLVYARYGGVYFNEPVERTISEDGYELYNMDGGGWRASGTAVSQPSLRAASD